MQDTRRENAAVSQMSSDRSRRRNDSGSALNSDRSVDSYSDSFTVSHRTVDSAAERPNSATVLGATSVKLQARPRSPERFAEVLWLGIATIWKSFDAMRSNLGYTVMLVERHVE